MKRLLHLLGLAALLTIPSCNNNTVKYTEYRISLDNGDNAQFLVFPDKKLLNIISSKGKLYFFGDCMGNDNLLDSVKIIDEEGKTTYSRSLGERETAGMDTIFIYAQELFDLYNSMIKESKRDYFKYII